MVNFSSSLQNTNHCVRNLKLVNNSLTPSGRVAVRIETQQLNMGSCGCHDYLPNYTHPQQSSLYCRLMFPGSGVDTLLDSLRKTFFDHPNVLLCSGALFLFTGIYTKES